MRDNCKVLEVGFYVGGFPCQLFSTMGEQQGFDDHQGRGTSFPDSLHSIQTKLPKVFILENVRGLATINDGKDLSKIIKLLRQVRFRGDNSTKAYVVKHKIMNTKEQGIPHSKPRWYCVGVRKDASKVDFLSSPGCLDCPALESLLHDEGNCSEFRNSINQVTNTMQANINLARQRIREPGGNLDQP